MTKCIVFSLPNESALTKIYSDNLDAEIGKYEVRHFPDGESFIRIDSDVSNKTVIILCGLDHPDNKILVFLFIAKTIRELGASKIILVSPYLPYMRQDIRFHPGEAVTSKLFATILSECIDGLITIDPHLHRIHHLFEIYSIPLIATLHATDNIAHWIMKNIQSPFIIGPDEESRQWVAKVADSCGAEYAIISKIRHGDRSVTITVPDITATDKTPILVDDIISTGTSMLAAIEQLRLKGFNNPVCIGVHALFDKTIYDKLISCGAKKIITCNTIPHFTNDIDINKLIIDCLKKELTS